MRSTLPKSGSATFCWCSPQATSLSNSGMTHNVTEPNSAAELNRKAEEAETERLRSNRSAPKPIRDSFFPMGCVPADLASSPDPGGRLTLMLIRSKTLRLSSLAEGDAEAGEVDAAGRRHHEAVCRTGEFDLIIPTATAEYFEFSLSRSRRIFHVHGGIRCEPVEAPFPDVAV